MEAAKQFRKRNAILACLQGTTSHPSAEMVYEMLQKEHPDISLATVYRNLARFKSQGLVTSVATVRGVERFDAMTHSHVHFICTGCDAVLDLPQMEIPLSLNEEAEKTSGCHVQDCRLTFTGLCGRCASK
ncbi:MAG: transcriptional repressor [Clostridiales bacterium]|nr:transcriptional repressor [Clostridiales bacterium]MCI6935814.1 transcriptional repressor [Clostridiales bacterium]MDD5883542.1 transcriptional repressor [Bacillota bacterium]